ncbi:hypothetical protein JCM11641_006962 [Rhodosporidiobolus odoratus]
MPVGTPPSVSPAAPPTAPILPSSDQQACLTPPSVRRRELRVQRCAAYAAARGAVDGEHDGVVREVTGYAAEEVDARRAAQRAAAWQGWEVEAEGYEPLGQGMLRADGTVNWEALPSTDAVDAVPDFITPAPALGSSLLLADAPARPIQHATLPGPAFLAIPSFPSTPELPSHTLPFLLGAVYVLARALGVGDRRRAQAEPADKMRERERFE